MVGRDAARALPRVHSANQHFKTWLRGTYRGVSDNQMQVYLDEFVFRFNRRRTPMAAFQTLLGLGNRLAPPVMKGSGTQAWPCGANRIGRSWPYLHQAEPH